MHFIGPCSDKTCLVNYLLLSMHVQSGWSPLTCACDGGHLAIVSQLLAHGADTELYTHKVRAYSYISFKAISFVLVLLVWTVSSYCCC